MTSNRPPDESKLTLSRNEAERASRKGVPQRRQSVSAAREKPALNMTPENELIERIVDQANFEMAWKKVKANRGAPGPDGVTLDKFFESFRHHWPLLRQQLLDGIYRPGPARRKSIPKPDGSMRHLGPCSLKSGQTW